MLNISAILGLFTGGAYALVGLVFIFAEIYNIKSIKWELKKWLRNTKSS